MAAGRIVIPPYFPVRNGDGYPVSGAELYVYQNNTSLLATIYTDFALTIPAANPVQANVAGVFPDIFAEAGTEADPVLYSVAVTDSVGRAPGRPSVFDNYRPSVDYETATLILAEQAADNAQTLYDTFVDLVDNDPVLQAPFLAPGLGASSVPMATYLRNKLQLGSYGGLLGSISSDRAKNTLAYNQLYAAVLASGRGVAELPKNEILLNPGIIHASPSIKVEGSGGTETILNFGASAIDCITINASINSTMQGIGFNAPGATAGSIVKVTGCQTPSLMDLHFFGGYNLLEITGASGGVNIENIDASAYTNFGVWLHDNVQGVNWRGGNLNAGSFLTGIGLRCEGFVSSVRVTDVEILAGLRGIQATGALGDATGLCYSEFKGVYCDASAQANVISYSTDVEWIGGWFSAGRGFVAGSYDDGLALNANRNLTFTGTRFKNAGRHGVTHAADNQGVAFNACSATNNGQAVANSRGFSFGAGSQRFQIIGGFSNNTSYSGGGQSYGVVMDTCSNGSIVGHNAIGNDITGILNTTPGANLYITSCPGTANYP